MAGKGKFPPLEETTSTAYGVDRDAVSEALAEGCPVRPSSNSRLCWEVCPVKKA